MSDEDEWSCLYEAAKALDEKEGTFIESAKELWDFRAEITPSKIIKLIDRIRSLEEQLDRSNCICLTDEEEAKQTITELAEQNKDILERLS